MSKPRYKWWGFAKAIIRAYPAHCDDLKALREQSITPAYSAAGHGSEVHRTSEDTALCELPPTDMKEYNAVEKTIQTTLRTCRDGEEVVEDAKGVKTAVYQLKKKLMAVKYGILIQEV